MCPELIATGFGKAEAPSDKSLYPYFSSPSTPRRLPWLGRLLIRPRCLQAGARWPGRGRGFGDERGRDTGAGVGWPGKGRRAGRRRSPGGRCRDRATFPGKRRARCVAVPRRAVLRDLPHLPALAQLPTQQGRAEEKRSDPAALGRAAGWRGNKAVRSPAPRSGPVPRGEPRFVQPPSPVQPSSC